MRWLLAALLLLLAVLQYRLWFAQGSLAEQRRLEQQVREQTRINADLRERNDTLQRQVLDLKNGTRGIEQRARQELGLIREGEIYYQLVPAEPATVDTGRGDQ